MGETPQIVNLCYPDYIKVLSDGMWSLLQRRYKTDFEVIASGGRHFQVHQLVLAIFCPQFENYSHPTYQLNSVDLDEQDLGILLEFLYRGAISVSTERLEKLRIAAVDLGLQALIDVIDCFRDHEKSSIKDGGAGSKKRKGINPVKLNSSKRGRRSKPKIEPSVDLIKLENLSVENMEAGDQEEEDDETDDATDANYVSSLHQGTESQFEISGGTTNVDNGINVNLGRKLRSGWKSGMTKPTASPKSERSRRSSRPKEYLKCPHCNYGTYQRGTFNYHLETHEAHREFICEVCTKVFRNRRKYLGHVKAHKNPELVIQCTHCDYRTPTRSVLNQHMAARHHIDPQGNKLEMNLKCPQCDFMCVSQFQLKNHLYKHSSKPYKCGECEFSAVRQSMIERHKKIKHRDIRPLLCDQCGYRGKTLGAFKYHLLRHTGEKKFVCDICGQAFALNWYLKQHQKVHSSDDKPFPCHLCSFATRKRYNLQVHLGHVHKLDPLTVKAALSYSRSRNVNDAGNNNVASMPVNSMSVSTVNMGVVTAEELPLLHDLHPATLIEPMPRLDDCSPQALAHLTQHVIAGHTITHMPQFMG